MAAHESREIDNAPPPVRLSDFSGSSSAMQAVLIMARRVVATDTSLLLLGETGVGKEMLARAIHADSPRAAGPFQAVNCGAIPEALLESELFGHEEGAFTGAVKTRRGHLELAHRGTLFLDEIADMPVHLQVKLLRVLQEHRFTRVGGEREVVTDVRVMAATNRDMEVEMRAQRFRPDLYYRIGVVTLTLPPLRERREDVPELALRQLRRFARRFGREVVGIDAEALAALQVYPWPGNVRELANVLERAVLLCADGRITLADLPATVVTTVSGASSGSPVVATSGATAAVPASPVDLTSLPLREARRVYLRAMEQSYLEALLRRTGGRVGETARRAGITPRALYDKMRRLGLRKENYR